MSHGSVHLLALPKEKWSKWFELKGKDSMPSMVLQSHRAKALYHSAVYYDRANCQQLFFSQKLTVPNGCVSDIDVFGLPPPNQIF